MAGGLLGLFHLHLLPKSWAAVVSKAFFWPTMPVTMFQARNNYMTKMDGEPRERTQRGG